MSGPMSDMLAVAQALARSKEADDALKEALSKLTENVVEQNSALADVVAALEKKHEARPAIDYDELARVLAAGVMAAIKTMPAPTAPAAAAPAPTWSSLDVKTPDGKSYVITRK